jgi:hypothetical protein
LKCPNCGANVAEGRTRCARCNQTIEAFASSSARKGPSRASRVAMGFLWAVFIVISITFLCLAIYRLYFWFDAWRLSRLYEAGGRLAPDVEEIMLDDGREGHAITFYGEDGNSVFIKELGRSYLLTGGLTRIEVPDSSWFQENPEDLEAAVITMTPVLESENGARTFLPPLELTVDVPQSPLTLISPSSDFLQVVNSIHSLQLKVVPGSKVLVNGEDVTDVVDFAGSLSANINVGYGDNNISILVSTPNHKETRKDIVLYREPQDIPLEPSLNLAKTSSKDTMTISGTMDPSAALVVDTDYVQDSIKIDQNGGFSFKAKFTVIGDNTVTFRAQKPGLTDSVISVHVNYVPTLNEYSRKAWKMDYKNLLLTYRQWYGKIFLCKGRIVEILQDETPLIVMNVGTEDTPQYVILDNASSTASPSVGVTYTAYADVAGNGNYFYGDDYCPRLTARYILAPNDQ